MKRMPKKMVVFALSVSLLCPSWPAINARPVKRQPLSELINKSYLELLETVSTTKFAPSEIEAFRVRLEKERNAEKKRLEREEQQLKKQADDTKRQLDTLNKRASRDDETMAEERRKIHCHLLKLENEMNQKKAEREHGLPVSYDNKRAKLDLIQRWGAKKREIADLIASGRARSRQYGNVEDIGLRTIAEGQEKDVKLGQDAVKEMKAYGLMPLEIEDKEIKAYLQTLADTIAVNSDLKIPVRVTLLDSDEINAFALPGGYFYLNTGIIEKADNESELVGVMAHELAHVSARHGAKLMKRATIAGIIYEAAQVAAMIFTGGVVSIGMYYALQYGFFGLGMLLSLTLLGVSREYEAEADQLGVQYTWKAGYDPKGFVTFFDKMASEKGYAKSASFFRTHPPFADRIFATFSEIEYLPRKDNLQYDSSRFHQIKTQLQKVKEECRKEAKKRPTLRRLPQCDDEPDKSLPRLDAHGRIM